jgi:hypothetical protein
MVLMYVVGGAAITLNQRVLLICAAKKACSDN